MLKNKDTKGQLMSLQQTLRQEIHAKIGAQSAEASAKCKVGSTCPTQPYGQTLPLWQDLSAQGTMHMINICNTAHSCLVIRAANSHAPTAFPCRVCMDADFMQVISLLSASFASCSWSWQKQCWLLYVGERVARQHARAAGGTGPGDHGPQTGSMHSGRGVSPQKPPGSQV